MLPFMGLDLDWEACCELRLASFGRTEDSIFGCCRSFEVSHCRILVEVSKDMPQIPTTMMRNWIRWFDFVILRGLFKLNLERVLKRSYSKEGSLGRGTDWSYNPQFASVRGMILVGSRKSNEGFDLSVIAAGELNAEVGSAFEVTDCVFCSVNMARAAFIVELWDEVCDGGKIWTSLAAKPIQGPDIFLENFVEMPVGRRWACRCLGLNWLGGPF